ncbi:MAG: hypothetical protein KatS3mg022_1235 [Armatimonadota bacterium]|nr:MAG: hypothetical protein KatS3mg022_1235 [Armatimonadota bacterium]
MPKRKNEVIATPSEATISLLEQVRGVSDVRDERIVEAAGRLLALPQTEQIAAAQWMGAHPEYASMLAYLVAKAGVTGALRRAVKQALFELRRRGVQVTLTQEQKDEHSVESPALSRAWVVDEVFAASPYSGANQVAMVHIRFFMRHASGQRAAFLLNIDPEGYLSGARLADEGVDQLYRECLDYPFAPKQQVRPADIRNEFVRVPVDWAVRVVHATRERNLRDHVHMPAHAAFYWGRLPAPPEEPIPHPIDSIPDAETGWLVSSLVTADRVDRVTPRMVFLLAPYVPHPDRFGLAVQQVTKELDTRIVLTPQTEEERRKQAIEKIRQLLFPDERLRDTLLYMLPLCGSIALLGGDRESAVWLKALWRELKERPDRPFYNTEVANFLVSIALHLFMTQEGIEIPREGKEQTNEPPTLQT